MVWGRLDRCARLGVRVTPLDLEALSSRPHEAPHATPRRRPRRPTPCPSTNIGTDRRKGRGGVPLWCPPPARGGREPTCLCVRVGESGGGRTFCSRAGAASAARDPRERWSFSSRMRQCCRASAQKLSPGPVLELGFGVVPSAASREWVGRGRGRAPRARRATGGERQSDGSIWMLHGKETLVRIRLCFVVVFFLRPLRAEVPPSLPRSSFPSRLRPFLPEFWWGMETRPRSQSRVPSEPMRRRTYGGRRRGRSGAASHRGSSSASVPRVVSVPSVPRRLPLAWPGPLHHSLAERVRLARGLPASRGPHQVREEGSRASVEEAWPRSAVRGERDRGPSSPPPLLLPLPSPPLPARILMGHGDPTALAIPRAVGAHAT
jgi:hypothetical protein